MPGAAQEGSLSSQQTATPAWRPASMRWCTCPQVKLQAMLLAAKQLCAVFMPERALSE